MESMDHIIVVAPLDRCHLYVRLHSGSTVTVNFTQMMETARFYRLKEEALFRDVRTDGSHVIWGRGEVRITARELMDAALMDGALVGA